MRDVIVQIDSAGRIVLPKSIGQHLAIKTGDRLKLSIQGNALSLIRVEQGLSRKSALVFSTGGDATLGTRTVGEIINAGRSKLVASSFGWLAGRRKSK